VLPNITTSHELRDYAAVPDMPPLSSEELSKLDELWKEGFYFEQSTVAVADRE
jgi:hypothetical protein